ncbi:MAG: ParB/RepB/Spo0J family partition protein [Firmicutes bacterium]|nr:ParB/RepB/Spo0J family partition protein [Bacillota bacterium]
MIKRRGLGKGLQALLPVMDEGDGESGQLKEIEVEAIRPAPRQARRIFDQEKLDELAASIKEHGVIQPVVVRVMEEGGYELIAGERRWRACKAMGYKKIPAVIKEYRDLEATAVSLIENVQREDLNPLEEATAYSQLMEEFGLTQEEVSGRVGKSRPFVANMVRLLGLPDEIKEMLSSGLLNVGHARALLALKDKNMQLEAAQKIIKQQLNVRTAEQIVKKLIEKKEKKENGKEPPQAQDKWIKQTEENVRNFLGTKVRIKESPNGGGKLEIYFSNEADLIRILDIVAGER